MVRFSKRTLTYEEAVRLNPDPTNQGREAKVHMEHLLGWALVGGGIPRSASVERKLLELYLYSYLHPYKTLAIQPNAAKIAVFYGWELSKVEKAIREIDASPAGISVAKSNLTDSGYRFPLALDFENKVSNWMKHSLGRSLGITGTYSPAMRTIIKHQLRYSDLSDGARLLATFLATHLRAGSTGIDTHSAMAAKPNAIKGDLVVHNRTVELSLLSIQRVLQVRRATLIEWAQELKSSPWWDGEAVQGKSGQWIARFTATERAVEAWSFLFPIVSGAAKSKGINPRGGEEYAMVRTENDYEHTCWLPNYAPERLSELAEGFAPRGRVATDGSDLNAEPWALTELGGSGKRPTYRTHFSKRDTALYHLEDPREPGVVRYIGITSTALGVRLKGHILRPGCSPSRNGEYNAWMSGWLRDLSKHGLEPVMRAVSVFPNEAQAKQAEEQAIREAEQDADRFDLLNLQHSASREGEQEEKARNTDYYRVPFATQRRLREQAA